MLGCKKAVYGIYLGIFLAVGLFLVVPQEANGYFCACYDPGTGQRTGGVYETSSGNCGAITACNNACPRTCALCKPDGGVDCGLTGGGGGGGSSGSVSITNIILALINYVLRPLIGALIILATVVFIWGVTKYVAAGGDAEKIKEGRDFIFWGLIGLFVIISVWGLVAVINNTFGIPQSYPTP